MRPSNAVRLWGGPPNITTPESKWVSGNHGARMRGYYRDPLQGYRDVTQGVPNSPPNIQYYGEYNCLQWGFEIIIGLFDKFGIINNLAKMLEMVR